MGEKTLGVIGGVRSGRRHWSLVVTSERIIVATVGKAGLGAAFEVGGILMAKSRAKRRTERLSQQAPEAVLGDHKLNYDIPYSGDPKREDIRSRHRCHGHAGVGDRRRQRGILPD